ncbi:MAG: two pore domain potassium channel family protein [Blastocatellia bacterium]|nr:MAG: two pore domain potassium channel family protein [Blastocatellia bacterium]
MRTLALVCGLVLIFAILWDVFEAVILPRRVTRRLRLTNLFYSGGWVPWSNIARKMKLGRRREAMLSLFGPLSLLILLGIWAFCLILGYTLLFWGTNTVLNAGAEVVSFWTYLYLSGVTFFTLGYGDISPTSPVGRALAVIETANGFSLFALVISYLPVLYQSFSRREASISLLDARAGSPSSAVELLRRHRAENSFNDLNRLLTEWELWSAELLESHLSYPVLCYFRSQHDNQSWIRALTTILDTCSLLMLGLDDAPGWQARMTFAIARHAVVDIAQVLRTAPSPIQECAERLSSDDLHRMQEILAQNRVDLTIDEASEKRLEEFRKMYEPYVFALAKKLLMPLPPWILPEDAIDNWKTSAWGRLQ